MGVVPVLAALVVEIMRSLLHGQVDLDIGAALSMSAAFLFSENACGRCRRRHAFRRGARTSLKEGTGIWSQTYNSKKCFMRGLVDDIEVLTEGKLILATGSARACRQALVGPGHHLRL